MTNKEKLKECNDEMQDRNAIINIHTYAQKISNLVWEINREKDSLKVIEALSCIRFNADAILHECAESDKRAERGEKSDADREYEEYCEAEAMFDSMWGDQS